MNVSDPSAVQAAQHISPQPQAFHSTVNAHTPHSRTRIATSSYSSPRVVQPNPAVYRPPSHAAATSYYPMSNFSVPDSFIPVRPPPPPPVQPVYQQQQQLGQPRPSTAASYSQCKLPSPPSSLLLTPLPCCPSSCLLAPSPAPPRPKNGSRVVGGNRGALGSHIMNVANPNQMPTCSACHSLVRGPFISAIGKVFCPSHFVCQHPSCGLSLETCGFVEEDGKLYCEKDFQLYFAPTCFKCKFLHPPWAFPARCLLLLCFLSGKSTIMGECSYALEKSFHPECFVCVHCKVKLGSGTFHMEDGLPYCPKDFAALFAQKCTGCEFPIEAGDQFFEAINQLWHCECFTCQVSVLEQLEPRPACSLDALSVS